MALALTFTIQQSADCTSIVFDDTTGTSTGGYGDSGNPVATDIKGISLYTTFPDGTSKYLITTYTPDAAVTFSSSIATWDDGVYVMKYTVYKDAGVGGSGISLTAGTEYMAVGGTVTDSNNVEYKPGDATNGVFTAASGVQYTEGTSAIISVKVDSSKTNNFILFCGVRTCLKDLLLQKCKEKCDCNDEFDRAVNQMYVDLNGAILAFQYGNHTCANEVITRLTADCSDVCEDCGC